MSTPGSRKLGEDLAPQFSLLVEGTEVKGDLHQLIQSVEFESSIDMADVMDIEILNPGFVFSGDSKNAPDVVAHKAFQPGNELELRIGYGRPDTFIGRAIITKHMPQYPQNGMPVLRLKAYDKSYLMMNASGPLTATQNNKVNLVEPRPADDKDNQGTIYVGVTASQIVEQIADKYGMGLNYDPTSRVLGDRDSDGIIQKKGMTDYQLVQILANLNRRIFYVDYSPERKLWEINWLKPTDEQNTPEFVFVYNDEFGTLLQFDAEYGLKDTVNEVVVLAYDRDTQSWVSAVQIEDAEGPNPRFKAGGGVQERAQETKQRAPGQPKPKTTKKQLAVKAAAVESKELINKTLESATEFRLAAGGVAIDVVSDQPFKSIEAAAEFALRWFKARRDHFIIGRGSTIGVESLRSGQVHRLTGLGTTLDGDWYFINVRHKIAAGGLYTCDFTARKILV